MLSISSRSSFSSGMHIHTITEIARICNAFPKAAFPESAHKLETISDIRPIPTALITVDNNVLSILLTVCNLFINEITGVKYRITKNRTMQHTARDRHSAICFSCFESTVQNIIARITQPAALIKSLVTVQTTP